MNSPNDVDTNVMLVRTDPSNNWTDGLYLPEGKWVVFDNRGSKIALALGEKGNVRSSNKCDHIANVRESIGHAKIMASQVPDVKKMGREERIKVFNYWNLMLYRDQPRTEPLTYQMFDEYMKGLNSIPPSIQP